jgi:uncharacterized membrane protein
MRPNKIFTVSFPVLQEGTSQQTTAIHRRSRDTVKKPLDFGRTQHLSPSVSAQKENLQRFKAVEDSLKNFHKYQLYSGSLVVRVARAKTEAHYSPCMPPRSNSSSSYKTTYQSFNDKVELCRPCIRPSNATPKSMWRRLVPQSLPQPSNKLKIVGKNLQVM